MAPFERLLRAERTKPRESLAMDASIALSLGRTERTRERSQRPRDLPLSGENESPRTFAHRLLRCSEPGTEWNGTVPLASCLFDMLQPPKRLRGGNDPDPLRFLQGPTRASVAGARSRADGDYESSKLSRPSIPRRARVGRRPRASRRRSPAPSKPQRTVKEAAHRRSPDTHRQRNSSPPKPKPTPELAQCRRRATIVAAISTINSKSSKSTRCSNVLSRARKFASGLA